MSKRNLSLIIVPHDRGHSRTIKTSYFRLKVLAVLAALCLAAGVIILGHYVVLLKRSRDMARLEAENRDLREKVALIEDLNRRLESYEVYVKRINYLLGVGMNEESQAASPAGRPEGQAGDRESGVEVIAEENERSILVHSLEGEIPSEWPLTRRGFITRGHMESHTSHPGVDIAVPEGTPVRATASGLVSRVGWDTVYGNFIEVKHSEGYSTLYGHNSALLVQQGQWVRRGEIIAFSGNTGRSTAPHLHYEVRCKGVPVDPQPYMLGYGKGRVAEG